MVFDLELVESTTHIDGDCSVDIYKVGGGTVGRSYQGLWGYRVTKHGKIIASGEDFHTGMPKTHREAARLVIDCVDAEK